MFLYSYVRWITVTRICVLACTYSYVHDTANEKGDIIMNFMVTAAILWVRVGYRTCCSNHSLLFYLSLLSHVFKIDLWVLLLFCMFKFFDIKIVPNWIAEVSRRIGSEHSPSTTTRLRKTSIYVPRGFAKWPGRDVQLLQRENKNVWSEGCKGMKKSSG